MKRINKVILIGVSMILLVACSQDKGTSVGTTPEIEKKIEVLLSKMTLDEKIGQMNQISAEVEITELLLHVKDGKIGSVLNLTDPEKINTLQKVAMEESRLQIPLLIGRDVIHGFKTIFPIPLGLASTFDPDMAQRMGRVSSIEATSVGVRWTFSPMLDIARDPRWGRMAEGSGEDTYLDCVMGAALVKGYQGELGSSTSMAACAKHFVGYGAGEGGRDYNSSNIPERLMRNVYFPPFEAAVKAGAMTVMTSFNDNDGVPSTGNAFILKDVLRNEWGFDGLVVTDWASANEMIAHGFAKDAKDAAAISANAGVDMDMMSLTYINNIKALIGEGIVSEKDVDKAVGNILRVKFLLGLFDNPYVNMEKASQEIYSVEHLASALKAAEESAILLKNDHNTLPLDENKIKTILITGPMADAPYDQLGTWCFDGESSHTITPLAAVRELCANKITVLYEPALAFSRDKDTQGILKAVAAANKADLVLAFVGEEAILSGEAHSLADLNLVGAQSELLEALHKTGKPVITTIIAGRPLTIGRDLDHSDALLYSFHPGTMGGPALANLIFGKTVPSGRTPVTFPAVVGQIPIYYNHNMTGRPFQGNETMIADIPLRAGQTSLGNTSYYLDAGAYPLFPFGYGMSYTTFEYSDIRLDKKSYIASDLISISFTLTNSGSFDAEEVVQVYVRDMVGSITRPVKELKQFKRIFLKAGESESVEISLPVSELAFWNSDMAKVVEPGDFQLWVAGDSASGEAVGFCVE